MKWDSIGKQILSAVCCGALLLGGMTTAFADEVSIAVQEQETIQTIPAADSSLVFDEVQEETAVHVKTIDTGVYTIDNVKLDRSMKVYGSKNTSGKKIVAADKTIAGSEKFRVQYLSNGRYKITAFSGSGYGLSVGSRGSVLKLSKTAESFYIDQNANGTYAIVPTDSEGCALQGKKSGVVLAKRGSSFLQSWTFDSKVTEDESAVLRKLADIRKIYPHGRYLGGGYSFNGAYQCMGFGREVFYRTFGKKAAWSYDGSPKTSSDKSRFRKVAVHSSYAEGSMRTLISKAKAGDVLQMNAPKIHTMIYVSSDRNGFTVYDANWIGANQVGLRYVSYGAWSSRNSRSISLLRATNYPAE